METSICSYYFVSTKSLCYHKIFNFFCVYQFCLFIGPFPLLTPSITLSFIHTYTHIPYPLHLTPFLFFPHSLLFFLLHIHKLSKKNSISNYLQNIPVNSLQNNLHNYLQNSLKYLFFIFISRGLFFPHTWGSGVEWTI